MAGISIPGAEQGRLAPSGRSHDEGNCTPHGSVHPLQESWARYHIQAGGRHGDFRREQVEGRCACEGGGRSGSGRLKRTQRAGRLRTRCSLC